MAFTNGLSIRSAEEAAWAQRTLPMQQQLPRLIACVVFFCLTLFSAILAYSAPRYNDLWALAAFCGAMFFRIWIQTPYYTESFDHTDSTGIATYVFSKMLANTFLTFAAVSLTLSFFRVRGYFLWLILALTSAWSVKIIYESWPFGSSLPFSQLTAESQAKFVIALLASQIITFAYGYYSLAEQYQKFKADGLTAMLRPMKRRFTEAAPYTIGMGIMLAAYLKGTPLQSTTAGPDLFLLFALLPATFVFMQFYWMMGAGTRFRERLIPQLAYADYLVMELKQKALEDTYDGVLAAFDLKGYKKLMALKLRIPAHHEAVTSILHHIRADIARLVATDRTVFRYKSNGDEWIYSLYAKDAMSAKDILTTTVHNWYLHGSEQVIKWQNQLLADLGPHAEEPETKAVIAGLDLHVMFCLLKNMTINAEGGTSRPDYVCNSLTFLSPAFKHAHHNRIAMYADEAKLVLSRVGRSASYTPLGE